MSHNLGKAGRLLLLSDGGQFYLPATKIAAAAAVQAKMLNIQINLLYTFRGVVAGGRRDRGGCGSQ